MDQRSMRLAMIDFGRKLKRGGVGLFYFAGHGVQFQNQNYLIPVGALISVFLHCRLVILLGESQDLGQCSDQDNVRLSRGGNVTIFPCQSENTFPVEKVEPTLVVFRVADINLRAGPGVRFYQVSVLAQVFEAKATRK